MDEFPRTAYEESRMFQENQTMHRGGTSFPPLGNRQPQPIPGLRTSPVQTSEDQLQVLGFARTTTAPNLVGQSVSRQQEGLPTIADARALESQRRGGAMNNMIADTPERRGVEANANGALTQVNLITSPDPILTRDGPDWLALMDKESKCYTDRWIDLSNSYSDMHSLINGAIAEIFPQVKFLASDMAWQQPRFVSWIKKLEEGELEGVKNVSVPFVITRHVFQNWAGDIKNKVSSRFHSDNIQAIVHFWKTNHSVVKKLFNAKRSNISGAVKRAFMKKLKNLEHLSQAPPDDEVRRLTKEKVESFGEDFEALVWYCAYCRVFRRKNSNMRKDMVENEDNMVQKLAERAFVSFIRDITPAMINIRSYEKKYLSMGFPDVVSVSDEAWALVVLEGWFALSFEQLRVTTKTKEPPKFDHIDTITLEKFKNVRTDHRKPWDAEIVKDIYNTAVSVIKECRKNAKNKSLQKAYEIEIRGEFDNRGKKRKLNQMEFNEIVVNVETDLEISL